MTGLVGFPWMSFMTVRRDVHTSKRFRRLLIACAAMMIREERQPDEVAVERIVREAFGKQDEADLVARLRERGSMRYPLVACEEDDVVGFVVASPITIDPPVGLKTLGIAPLAVDPSTQGNGVGSALMHRLIEHAQADGIDALFLLGNPAYYQRFGFVTSHLANEYGATDAFMHRELTPDALAPIRGAARYVDAFREIGV